MVLVPVSKDASILSPLSYRMRTSYFMTGPWAAFSS